MNIRVRQEGSQPVTAAHHVEVSRRMNRNVHFYMRYGARAGER